MEKYNVLVFPAGTEIALEIRNALKDSKFIRLFGATSVPCHAEMVFKNCDTLPYTDDPRFIDELNKVIIHNAIDYVYPAHDDALVKLTCRRDEIKAEIVTSAKTTVFVCRSKKRTYGYLKDAWYVPKTYLNAVDVKNFPVFVKPDIGQGSNGAELVETRDRLYGIVNKGDYVICEYLPGAEYTVDCFTDIHGVLRYVGQRTRERIRSGIAVRSRFVDTDEAVKRIAQDLNQRFGFNGAWFFQLKEDKYGDLKLLEVAPRIAGTMGLSRNIGVNLPLLTMYNMWEKDVEILKNGNAILLDRAFISRFDTGLQYDSVYVDFDDTLVSDGKVNPTLIAFLYQCRNNGKKLRLITKRRGAIEWYVDPYMFDEIIQVGKDEKKEDYVKPHSIFIDDSFSERKRVHEKCGVPVFDVDAVESLMDWRV